MPGKPDIVLAAKSLNVATFFAIPNRKSKLLLPAHNVPVCRAFSLTLFRMLCKKSKAAAVTLTVTTGRKEYQFQGFTYLFSMQ